MKKALNQLFFFSSLSLALSLFLSRTLSCAGLLLFQLNQWIIKGESRAEFPADSGRLPWGSTPYIPAFPYCYFTYITGHFLTLLAGQSFSLWPHGCSNCPAVQKLRKKLHSMEKNETIIHFSYSFSFCLSSGRARLHDSIDVLTSSSCS